MAAPHPAPHPSGLPDAPWAVEDGDSAFVLGASGREVLAADALGENDDADARRIARAAAELPALVAATRRIVEDGYYVDPDTLKALAGILARIDGHLAPPLPAAGAPPPAFDIDDPAFRPGGTG